MLKLISVVFLGSMFGCQGPVGPAGVDGRSGIDGSDGPEGPAGPGGPTGTPGADGEDGGDGIDGSNGLDAHFGPPPWGISLTIDEILGGTGPAGNLQVGDTPVIVFRVEDDDGVPYSLGQLSGLDLQIAGPSEHMQVVLPRNTLSGIRDDAVWNADGTWTYTSPTPIPAMFGAPANDTTDIGVIDGDWGGQPLVDGTYRLAGWAYVRQTRADGTQWVESGNTAFDFAIGMPAGLVPHEVVRSEACFACHGPTLYQHGGPRADPAVCVTCHVAGSEDRHSTTDPSTTPGQTVAFGPMIHGIHMGLDRPDPLLINGFPGSPALPGYPDYNTHDFSEIGFPVWPEGVKTCETCHGGAAQGDVENRPTARDCTGCHSDVDLRSGNNHPGLAQPDDSLCEDCHTPSLLVVNHADLRNNAALNPGLTVTVLGVAGGSGPSGALEVGDTVTVQFSASHDDGTPVDLAAELAFSEIVFSGPTEHFQRVLVSGFGAVPTAVYDATSDSFSFVLGTVPAVYPTQANGTADLGPEVGEWEGLPLADGTYRVAVLLAMDVTNGIITERTPSSDTLDVLLGAATSLTPREVVRESNCEVCHQDLVFHGNNRSGLDTCLTCHTAGAEDRYSQTDPTTTPGATIHFPVMIHKIHNGSELENLYELNGFGTPYNTHGYNQIGFPRFDGGTSRCEVCHAGSDAYETPSGLICTSCHDGLATAAHVNIMTDPVFGESCDVCHGDGALFGVNVMHAWDSNL